MRLGLHYLWKLQNNIVVELDGSINREENDEAYRLGKRSSRYLW